MTEENHVAKLGHDLHIVLLDVLWTLVQAVVSQSLIFSPLLWMGHWVIFGVLIRETLDDRHELSLTLISEEF